MILRNQKSKVRGYVYVCTCRPIGLCMDVSGITSTSTIAAYSHLYLEMKTAFYILVLLTSGICGGVGSLLLVTISNWFDIWVVGTLDFKI